MKPQQTPNILIISGSYPPINCGIGFYTKQLAQAFEETKFEDFAVLTSTDVEHGPKVLPWVDKWNINAWSQVNKAVKQIRPNIIHIQYSSVRYGRRPFIVTLPYLLKARFPKLKIVVTIHEYHDASELGKWRVLSMISIVRNIVVSNSLDKRELNKRFKKKRIQIIPIGAMVEKTQLTNSIKEKLINQYSLANKTILLNWGIIDQAKGLEKLVLAMQELPDCKLLIIGKHDSTIPYHNQIQSLIEEGIGNIEWLGYIENKQTSELIQLSDIVVLAYNQPVSMRRSTIISSLAHGKPIITTGPSEGLLQHKQNCFLIDSNDADTIVNAVEQLRNNPKLARMIGERAAKLAADFNWESIASKHVQFYQKILGGPHS